MKSAICETNVCSRDFESVAKDNERAVSDMKALADSFEREVHIYC